MQNLPAEVQLDDQGFVKASIGAMKLLKHNT
jgi:hypothetical protein